MAAGELIITDKLVTMAVAPLVMQSQRMGRSGNSGVSRLGPTRWRLSVATEFLDLGEAARWSAWIARRDQAAYTFTGWSLFNYNPRGVVSDFADDAAMAVIVNAGAATIKLRGVAPGDSLMAGDMVSYRTPTAGYCLLKVTADTAAPVLVTGEYELTVPVWPRPLPVAETPQVRRRQALGEFELSTVIDPFEDYSGRALAFEAVQILR